MDSGFQRYFTVKAPSTELKESAISSQLDLFQRVVDLMVSADVSFFLLFGTCLGAVREQAFIAHDTDVDFGVFLSDVSKLAAVVEQLDRVGIYLSQVYAHKLCFSVCGLDVGLDFYLISRPAWMYRLLGYRWQCDHCLYRLNFFDVSHPKACSMVFYDRLVRLPMNPEAYLIFLYGADWRIPKKGLHAEYRGKLSQWITRLFVDSEMPLSFSGGHEGIYFKPWVSWVLLRFFPKADVTRLFKHRS